MWLFSTYKSTYTVEVFYLEINTKRLAYASVFPLEAVSINFRNCSVRTKLLQTTLFTRISAILPGRIFVARPNHLNRGLPL